jgi:two-component system chemotaxis response regulator CheB
LHAIRQDLIEKIQAAANVSTVHAAPERPQAPLPPPPVLRKAAKVDIVVLGISTGGPQALRYLMPQFPAAFPVPIAIVLHMPVGYTAMFAEKLGEISPLSVKEACEDCPLVPGQALLARAGRHLTFYRSETGLPRARFLSGVAVAKPHCPSVDVMFRSAADVYGPRVLGVVMTGMGDDGKEGAAWIKARGGAIITEAEESCIVYGMPRSVVEAGLSDASASLTNMAAEISKRL